MLKESEKEVWKCPWCEQKITVESGEFEQLGRDAYLHMLDEEDATKEKIIQELKAI